MMLFVITFKTENQFSKIRTLRGCSVSPTLYHEGFHLSTPTIGISEIVKGQTEKISQALCQYPTVSLSFPMPHPNILSTF